MDNESWRVGFEAALDLCIAETKKADNIENAIARMSEFLNDVKDDKIERLKEMLTNVHH